MSATYNPGLLSDLDWVRFLTGDTDTSSAVLSDEEISGLLTEEGNKYCAAAAVLGYVVAKYAAKGAGLKRKIVDDLSLEWRDGQDFEDAFRPRINELKTRCAQAKASSTHPFLMKAH